MVTYIIEYGDNNMPLSVIERLFVKLTPIIYIMSVLK